MLSKAVLNAIAITVTVIWALNFLAQFVPLFNYRSDAQINLIFGSLVGAAFALPKLLGGKEAPGAPSDPPGKHVKAEDEKT